MRILPAGVPDADLDRILRDLDDADVVRLAAAHVPYLVAPSRCQGCHDYFQAGLWPWPCRTATSIERLQRNLPVSVV